MELLSDPVTLVNLLLCIVIVILSIIGYMKIRSATPLFIGTAFFLFGVSHVATLLGLRTALEPELIVVRTLGYITVCIGVFLIIRDITLRMKTADELKTAQEGLEHRVEERTAELSTLIALLNEEIGKHQRAEAVLRESENTYHSLFTYTGAATVIVEQDSTILLANEAFAQLAGYPVADIEGKRRWTEFVVPDDLPRMAEFHRSRRIDSESAPTMYEFRFVNRSGTIRNILLHVGMIKGTTKSVASLLDITEHRRIEQAQQESREFLNKIINSIGDPIHVKDRQHRMILINDAACRLFGRSRQDIIGKTAYDLFPTKDMADISWQNDEEVFRIGSESVNEETNTYAPGITLTVLVKKTLYMDAAGNQFLVGITTDITKRKWAENAIRERERFLAATLDDMHTFVAVLKPDGEIFFVNNTPLKLIEKSLEQVRGMKFYDVDWWTYSQETQALIKDDIRRCASGERIFREIQVRTLDGLIWIDFHIHPVFGEDGAVQYVIPEGRDITVQKRIQMALREREEQYSALFSNSYSVSLLIDPDTGQIIDANDAACRYYGYSREQLTTMGIYDLNRLDKERVVTHLVRAKKGKEKHFFSTHYLASGEKRLVEIYSGPITVQGKPLFYSIIHDVTDRKKAEQALKESEMRLYTILQSSPIPKFVIDNNHRVISWNRALEETSGIRSDEVLGTTRHWMAFYQQERPCMADLIVDGLIDRIPELYKGKFQKSLQVEGAYGAIDFFPHMGRKGTWLHFVAAPIRDSEGAIIGAVETLEDITGLKEVEEALRKREQQYRSVVEGQTEFICRFLPDGTHVFVNEAYLEYFGMKRADMIGQRFKPDIPREDRQQVRDFFASLTPENPTGIIVHRIIMPDGEIRWQRWSERAIFDQDRKIIEYQSVGRDITEQKQMELALEKSERLLTDIINFLPDATLAIDDDGVVIAWNRAMEEMTGVPAEQMMGKGNYEYALPFYHERRPILVDAILTKDQTALEWYPGYQWVGDTLVGEMFIPHFNNGRGSHLWFTASVLYGTEGKPAGALESIRDITDRKNSEKNLIRAYADYQHLLDQIQDVYYRSDAEGRLILASRSWATLLGYASVDECIGKSIAKDFYEDPDERAEFLDAIKRDGKVTDYEITLRKKDGSPIPVATSSHFYYDEKGMTLGVEGTFRDITERKRMERDLIESQQRLHDIINFLPDPTYAIDSEGKVIAWNRAMESLLEVPADEVLGKGNYEHAYRMFGKRRPVLVDLVIHGDETVMKKHYPTLQKDGKMLTAELNIASLKGRRRVLWIIATPLIDERGKISGAIESMRDITRIHDTEVQLRASQQRFHDIINFLPDPTYAIDSEGKVIAWNRAMESLLEVPADEVIGKGNYEHAYRMFGKRRPVLVDLVIHGDETVMRKHYPTLQKDGQMLTAELNIASLKGRRRVLWITATPLYDAQGKTAGAIESLRDITHIRDTEHELQQLNAELEQRVRERTAELQLTSDALRVASNYNRSLFEADMDPLIMVRPDGTITDVNSAGERMTGISRTEIIGTHLSQYVREPEQAIAGFREVLEKGSSMGHEYEIKHLDGTVIPVMTSSVIIKDDRGGIKGVFISLHDISKVKKDEELIRTQLREKEILLREVHHRVKNNLQIVVSLINLQARSIADIDTVTTLRDIQNRIKAISIVHERLYLSTDVARIDLGAYARYLTTSLFSVYHVDVKRVSFRVDIRDVFLDIDTATPLGLILNELISNMLKYAFPDERKGEFAITGQQDAGTLTLVVKDNGVGIPDGIDWKNTTSLGLQLVRILTEQLQSTVELDQSGGTTFTIRIPLVQKSTDIHYVEKS